MGYDLDAIMRMNAEAEEKERKQEEQLAQSNQIVQLPVNELVPFPSELHKFKPATPKRMAELVDSIRQNGIINALIVRQLSNGRYQILTGHNRRTAAIQLGYMTVPCIVRILPDDDDAISVMVADNLNNRELLPSERGWAYRQLMDIRGRQGQRTDLTSPENWTKFRTSDVISREYGDSRGRIHRYIRLTYLIESLLELVDAGKIGVGTGEQLSYLKNRNQETVYTYCYAAEPTHPLKEAQAKALREVQADPDRIIDEDFLEELITKPKKVRLRTLKIDMSKFREYFPTGTPEEVVLQTIHTALAVYFEGKEE